MEIAEIKSKGYNSFKQQYELYALVKNPKAFSKYTLPANGDYEE